MDEDDLKPRTLKSTYTLASSLEALSVAELENLLTALDQEKLRVSAEIARKRAQAQAAESFFKPSRGDP